MSRLHAGDVAPSFRTTDLFGNPIDLDALRGSFVFLSFLRNAACAICNLRIHELISHHSEFANAGIAIIAVFESSADAMRRYVGRQDAPFPIVADPDARLYELFGTESSEAKVTATMGMPGTERVVADAAARGFALTHEDGSNFLRMPADFLIGPDGRIVRTHYAEFVWDHMPLAAVHASVDSLGALDREQAA